MRVAICFALMWMLAACGGDQPEAPAAPQPGQTPPTNAPAAAGPASPAAPVKRYGTCHALCIGINEYAGDGGAVLARGNLKAAENDAQSIAGALHEYGFDPANTQVLLGKDADRETILKRFRYLAASAGPDDVVIFFYAGHGISATFERGTENERRRGYLMPARIDDPPPKDIGDDWYKKSLVPMEELADIARKSKARHTLLLLDCCFSGLVAGATGRGSDEALNDYAELMAQPSCLAITAGTDREKANELPDAKHGVMTTAILKSLAKRRDTADPFSATEFFLDVRSGVRGELAGITDEHGQALTDSQNPQLLTLKQNKGELVWLPGGGVAEGKIASRKPPPRKVVSKKELGSRAAEIDHAGDQAKKNNKDLSTDPQWTAQRRELEEQAALGDPNAAQLLAIMKAQGVGTKQDQAAAYDHAREAAATGDPDANILLSNFFRMGVGVPANPQASERLERQFRSSNIVLNSLSLSGLLPAAPAGASTPSQPGSGASVADGVLGSLFGRDAQNVYEAMNEIERQRARLKSHYGEMKTAGRFDNDKRAEMALDWNRAVVKLKDLAAVTERKAEINGAADEFKRAIDAVRAAAKANQTGNFERSLAAAEEQVKKLRAVVGNDPAKVPGPK